MKEVKALQNWGAFLFGGSINAVVFKSIKELHRF